MTSSSLPFCLLEQSQCVKEVCWMGHPGSANSGQYLAVLQDNRKTTTIDVFPLRGLKQFSSTLCLTSLSLCKVDTVAGVLNADMRTEDHIPPALGANELFSFRHSSGRDVAR